MQLVPTDSLGHWTTLAAGQSADEGYGKLPASRVVRSAATGMDVGCRGWKLGREAEPALADRLAEAQAIVWDA